MASETEDSDDEPLSVLASLKSRNKSELEILPIFESGDSSRKIYSHKKKCNVSIDLQPLLNEIKSVVERPADVWLYFTDFSTNGPYSCLLCPEWFINRTRIVIHYAVDHKKDYCGICRYFVPNREAWWEHLKFHLPWKCTQCEENFLSHIELRDHFSSVHKVVHCRLCNLFLPDGEQYRNHLYQKHFITTFASIYKETLWDFECEGNQKFLCLLCSKSCNVGRPFADHFMAYHHLTLKCFMFHICGIDLPFSVKGAELSPEFIDTQLKAFSSFGYVDFAKNVRLKHEPIFDEVPLTVDCDPELRKSILKENYDDENDLKLSEKVKGYKGHEDFDITLMELIIMQQCYFDYVNETLNEINSNLMPHSLEISYVNAANSSKSINCCFCSDTCNTLKTFETHMTKTHYVKALPIYWCRVCAAVFDTLTELKTHCNQELVDFDDLWICQFCDKEFGDREETRKHLTEHWNLIQYDNCFSPHLGFKCKFCPTLFWNETDRECHHVRVHVQKNKSDFYKCTSCGETFGDKVFFIHHYLERHNGNNPTYLLKCCICCVVLQNVEEMRSHFEAEHPEARKTYCSMELCKFKPFSHRKSFFMHLKAIHDPANRPVGKVVCTKCGQEFNNAKACSLHATRMHGPAKFKCTICDEKLHTSDERKIHYLIRHPGRYEYQCNMCEKSFQYKSSLYMHKQDHAPNKKHFTCNYCSKAFLKKDSYREHILIHEAPRHACSYCPMRFVQRSNMLRHERRHTGERPYACQFCPRTFSDKGACTSHSRTHLKNTSFACVYCGQTFAQKSKLTYHIRRHTGENLETCSVCSKIFTSGCSLREHMKIHVRKKLKKTVKCPLCKNMYSDEKDMMRHMRAAHTGARFKCPLCRKCLCSASSLREHVLTHSRVKTYRCQTCPKSYHARKSIIKHLQIRHGLKPHEISPKTSYRHLNPKECNLDLDDDVIDRIFGNFKRKPHVAGDYVAFDNNSKRSSSSQQETSRNQNLSEGSEEENENTFIREGGIKIKIEPGDDEDEIPPPDFVNVKIECVEENDLSDAEMA